jgi:hypothetical protein
MCLTVCAKVGPMAMLACEACDMCAKACEKHPDDKVCATCAKACRDCK